MKNTVPSGGFAADGFFDRTDLQTEVQRKIRDRITGLVSLVDGGNRYAGPGDHWAPFGSTNLIREDPRRMATLARNTSDKVTFTAAGGAITIRSLTLHHLESIWHKSK